MTFTIGSQTFSVSEHIWSNHPDRVGVVKLEQIRETIENPERTQTVRGGRVVYLHWFPEMGSDGNYLAVIVDQGQDPYVVVTAMPSRNERRRRGRQS